MTININGLINWLKDWFYTKEEIDAQISAVIGTILIFQSNTLPLASKDYEKTICIVGNGYDGEELYFCIGEYVGD